MPVEPIQAETPPLEITRLIDALCDEFEASLKAGGDFSISSYCERMESPWRGELIKELACVALSNLRGPSVEKIRQKLIDNNQSLRAELERLALHDDGEVTLPHTGLSTARTSGLVVRCPHCH